MANMEDVQAIGKKLDEWLGLQSIVIPADNHAEFQYRSPTGVLLFTISVHWYRGAWRFASRTGLPESIDHLRQLVDPPAQGDAFERAVAAALAGD